DADKREFALGAEAMRSYGFGPARAYDLETVIRHMRPTILVGTSGMAGTFTEGALREMARHAPGPLVFPMSNPTSKTEAHPERVLEWTGGTALVATGSPFEPVERAGRTHLIGQANNAFVFPGVGLGSMVAEVRQLPDELFLAAAHAVADAVPDDRVAHGALYPRQADLRAVSRAVAVRVATSARDGGYGRALSDDQIERATAGAMWFPAYRRYRPA
ncbi:MAG TPA: malic enzyme-like NAD(P)-binding protein, partial [Actinomycetota bacterium]|nr:malic enzyme-like NAD(P)-binding protein [Actinomycetota bacterium]